MSIYSRAVKAQPNEVCTRANPWKKGDPIKVHPNCEFTGKRFEGYMGEEMWQYKCRNCGLLFDDFGQT